MRPRYRWLLLLGLTMLAVAAAFGLPKWRADRQTDSNDSTGIVGTGPDGTHVVTAKAAVACRLDVDINRFYELEDRSEADAEAYLDQLLAKGDCRLLARGTAVFVRRRLETGMTEIHLPGNATSYFTPSNDLE